MQYRICQAKAEISGLQASLLSINKKIYQGQALDKDKMLLESCLKYYQDSLHFTHEEHDWVSWEGKLNKKFLHLEESKTVSPLQTLFDRNNVEVSGTDNVLGVLHDFYIVLYSATGYWKSEDEIRAFLSAITSLPKITHCTDFLGSKICVDEVLRVIKSLHTGKALGSDGLTAEFYKHFAEDLAPVLTEVFNTCFEQGVLSMS